MRPYKVFGLALAGVVAITAGTAVQANAQNSSSSSSATSETAQRGQLSEKDYRFLEKAAIGGMEEVEMGQLAQQKASNPAVKSFGERMVTDHTKANDELKQLAADKGATLPTRMSHHDRSTMEHLQEATGADFDKAYVKAMSKDHRKDVKEFKDAAKEVKDPELRAWVEKTLPVLQQHERTVDDLETTLRNTK
jgi:putative membrane protein